jgi:hypothetical protein
MAKTALDLRSVTLPWQVASYCGCLCQSTSHKIYASLMLRAGYCFFSNIFRVLSSLVLALLPLLYKSWYVRPLPRNHSPPSPHVGGEAFVHSYLHKIIQRVMQRAPAYILTSSLLSYFDLIRGCVSWKSRDQLLSSWCVLAFHSPI